ncbi:hypothetical protein D3Z62_30650, partial [Lachnospiraceae bacterium]|nr:hypothetical protein [Lachnospiraceae bacterium]
TFIIDLTILFSFCNSINLFQIILFVAIIVNRKWYNLINNIFILFKKKNNTCGESGNCHKRKIMIEYQRGTIVLQGGNLPKLHTRFAGVHKRGGGANDSF